MKLVALNDETILHVVVFVRFPVTRKLFRSAESVAE